MNITIYHNPRCSKSRQTLALIEAQGVEPTVVKYLEQPPTAETLLQLQHQLGVAATEMIRFKEEVAKTLGLSKSDERSDQAWMTLLAENPKLIERPIVVAGDRAVLGRPPENVLTLF